MDFSWSNPVGAVANRFSRDMNELDLVLPNTLKNFIFQSLRFVVNSTFLLCCLFVTIAAAVEAALIITRNIFCLIPIRRICGTLFLVVFTFPANTFTMLLLVFGIAVVFRAYIRVSRLFRRLSSATMASVNGFVSDHVNGVHAIRTFRTQVKEGEKNVSSVHKRLLS